MANRLWGHVRDKERRRRVRNRRSEQTSWNHNFWWNHCGRPIGEHYNRLWMYGMFGLVGLPDELQYGAIVLMNVCNDM